jgi:hypothetical protein
VSNYPEDSVYGRADRRLREMADVLKQFGPITSDAGEDREKGD